MILSRITRRVLRWPATHSATARPLSWAPHPIELYGRVLKELVARPAAPPIRVTSLSSLLTGARPADAVSLVVRHDVDTLACVRQATLLAEVEESLGVRSDWFVRVDEYHYNCDEARPLVDRLRDAGHGVGLHVAPYLAEAPLDSLLQARTKFAERFGFEPATWTVHGFAAGDRLRARRRAFEDAIEQRPELLCQTDLSSRLYQRACGDAHFALDRSRTYFCQSDFDNLLAARAGEAVVLLTHPCYWGPAGIAVPPPGP